MNSTKEKKFSRKIWIDLDNSPHVPFFYPIAKKMSSSGYNIKIAARDCFHFCGLTNHYNMKCVKIGKHYGKNKIIKLYGGTLRNNHASLGFARCLGFKKIEDVHFTKLLGFKKWKYREVKK